MKCVRRTVIAAALIVATSASAADGSITPNPYTTLSGVGSFSTISSAGNSLCWLSQIRAAGASTTAGALGSFSGFNAHGCSGVVTAAQYDRQIIWSVSNGTVTLSSANLLITNIFGGRCLYSGTLTGSISRGGNSFFASGSIGLMQTLTGICTSSASASMQITLPGASITW